MRHRCMLRNGKADAQPVGGRLMVTGWGQAEDRRRTAEAGFNHHLVKPPEPKAVENVLAELKRPNVR